MVLVPTLLNVDKLPKHVTYDRGKGTIDMYSFLMRFQRVVDELAHIGAIRDNGSFGFAMASPQYAYGTKPVYEDSNNPSKLVWFSGGWGPEEDRHTANAVRKLRPLARTGKASTFVMANEARGGFRDIVPSADENGNYPWGDFPYGGGVLLRLRNLWLLGAVSGLRPHEDETVATMILYSLAAEIYNADGIPL